MTHLKPSADEAAAIKNRCLQCQAAPGEWCRTSGGNLYRRLHMYRWVVRNPMRLS